MSLADTSEKGLETLIEAHLIEAAGYLKGDPRAYDRAACVDPAQLFAFLQATQPAALARLRTRLGDRLEAKLLERIEEQVRSRGIVEVLRRGIKEGPEELALYFPRPASARNPTAAARYAANRFAITRQLHYSDNARHRSLDMVIFLNGLPLITFELKNRLTNQNVKDAIRQYQHDRDPREPLFAFGRCLVHFAVDDDLVYMTTHLRGEETSFLPFNQGHDGGAGNPPNPAGLKTDYLWKRILTKASLSDIVEKYAQLIVETDRRSGRKSRKLIFPRYHQLDLVRRLLAHARANGAGHRYLIQHSAGSGKSNSISWLAHQLVELTDPTGEHPIFDSIVVVTDRTVLDKQIRDNIKQFAHVAGVVQSTEHGSAELRDALTEGKKIIITTIQKFPWVIRGIRGLADKRFAILIDEAHSSQSGQAAAKMNATLGSRAAASPFLPREGSQGVRSESAQAAGETGLGPTAAAGHSEGTVANLFASPSPAGPSPSANPSRRGAPLPVGEGVGGEDLEDRINDLIAAQRLLTNASYFAFTATPKSKTLETFGSRNPADGKFYPFHTYSMRQAIEEEFILDVLANYTTYASYYKLYKRIDDDPLFDTERAQKKLRKYVEQHPAAIEQKTHIMVDHFHHEVAGRRKIAGHAKAMVVTSSILAAIRYKRAFDAYLRELKSPYRALVAFTGEKEDGGQVYTEERMNGFPSAEIPEQFAKDEYRFLIVAEKYQTGFDQPLLHTMYVDKPLSDVKAVQTLSRLNRAYKPWKSDTFVLDFVNTADQIQRAFEPFYQTTILSEATDLNRLNDLQDALDALQVYSQADVEELMTRYLREESRDQLDPILDRCAQVYTADLDADAQIDFKAKAKAFVRAYQFLVMIHTFEKPYWESLKTFLKLLLAKLPAPDEADLARGILESVDMDSYRAEQQATRAIALRGDEEVGPTPADPRAIRYDAQMDLLSNIIHDFNERFGTAWTDPDRVERYIFGDLANEVAGDEDFQNACRYSDRQNAHIAHDKKVRAAIQDAMLSQTELYKKFADDEHFREQLFAQLFRLNYDRPSLPPPG